ncbi:MAG: NUDIX hydrolase [Methylococcaceae bacterium]|nr:NUDIX hydrolase [Methylococcaceae bacterium]
MPKPITPLLAADAIIQLIDQPGKPFVLIERAYPPFGWAIPGGFVDVGETLENAAIREAKEETCLEVTLTALLGIYSNPKRDTRNHTVTAVYIAEATGMPTAADDAKNFGIFNFENLPITLAFDHAQVLEDFRQYRLIGKVTPLRIEIDR